MAYNWRNLSNDLINRFGKWHTYKRMNKMTYSVETGEPIYEYETVSALIRVEPIKKKGSIGGENELQYETSDFGDYGKGAFIGYTKSELIVSEQDEIKDLTVNGRNLGDFFVDRIQDWSEGNGIYKFRLLCKSMYPTRESWENADTNDTTAI